MEEKQGADPRLEEPPPKVIPAIWIGILLGSALVLFTETGEHRFFEKVVGCMLVVCTVREVFLWQPGLKKYPVVCHIRWLGRVCVVYQMCYTRPPLRKIRNWMAQRTNLIQAAPEFSKDRIAELKRIGLMIAELIRRGG